MVSAESRQIENEGLEAGLANIGLTLEAGEREVIRLWGMYENVTEPGTVTYPKIYQLKSDADRLKEAKEKVEIAATVNSQTYKREIAKDVVFITLGHKLSPETAEKIAKELDNSSVPLADAEVILSAKEQALMGDEFAAQLLGIPAGEAKKGADDHTARLVRIQIAQSEGDNNDATDPDAQSRKGRKTQSQDPNTNPDGVKRVRKTGRF